MITDVVDPERIRRRPDRVKVLVCDPLREHGRVIRYVDLREYIERHDEAKGPYSLITTMVKTDLGTIEMAYSEGFHGRDALDRTRKFVVENLGISGLILRALISLEARDRQ